MPTLLTITVGGSCAPIVTAIKDYSPDFILFFVSAGSSGSRITVDGEGKPCKIRNEPDQPNILRQTQLRKDQVQIVELSDPDDLPLCYKEIRKGLNEAALERQSWQLIADYTGGTKTMTVALSLAALESGWSLSLVKGARTDLISVVPGTEMAALVNTWEVRARQQIIEALNLFNAYAFASAGELLENLLREAPLSQQLQQKIIEWVTLARAFDAWDRFDHQRAYNLLKPFCSQVLPQWLFLKTLFGKMKGNGYEPVFDLLLNAERRAARGRYDDAVARLYRAMELLAQTRLKLRKPSLYTSNIIISDLPETLQAEYQKISEFNESQGKGKKIMLGLVEAYGLLAKLDDPLGKVFQERKKKILSALDKRNSSIFAHGNDPLDRDAYITMSKQTKGLITSCLKEINIEIQSVQFPRFEGEQLVQRT